MWRRFSLFRFSTPTQFSFSLLSFLTFSTNHLLLVPFLFLTLKSPVSLLNSLGVEEFNWFFHTAPLSIISLVAVEHWTRRTGGSYSSIPGYENLSQASGNSSHTGGDESKDTLLIKWQPLTLTGLPCGKLYSKSFAESPTDRPPFCKWKEWETLPTYSGNSNLADLPLDLVLKYHGASRIFRDALGHRKSMRLLVGICGTSPQSWMSRWITQAGDYSMEKTERGTSFRT